MSKRNRRGRTKQNKSYKHKKFIIGGVYIMQTPYTKKAINKNGIRKTRPVVVLQRINLHDRKFSRDNIYLCAPISTVIDDGVKVVYNDILHSIPVDLMCTAFESDLDSKVTYILSRQELKNIQEAKSIYLNDELEESEKDIKLKSIPLYFETDVEIIMKMIMSRVQENFEQSNEKRTKHHNQYELKNYPQKFKDGFVKMKSMFNYENFEEYLNIDYKSLMKIYNVSKTSIYTYKKYMREIFKLDSDSCK